MITRLPICRPSPRPSPRGRGGVARRCGFEQGFTLVELLAAMVFMAIVIPVTMQGLRIATRAGEVGQRKAVAARVLDRELNEYVAMSANQNGTGKTSGTDEENGITYKWKLKVENWNMDAAMRIVRCEVTYPSQGREFSIEGSTLVTIPTL